MRYHKDSGVNLFSSDDRLSELSRLGDPLEALSAHIDFEFFRATLEQGLYGDYDASKGGRPPFDPVMMFKVLVLQRLYNLSDDAIEFQIKDRLSFMHFLGVDFAGRVPDSKTVWIFREHLQAKGLVESLFEEFNTELEKRRIIVKTGQIVDASFVEVPRQRNTRDENKTIKSGEVPEDWDKNPNRISQKDTDARWTKKNNTTYFGYKNHIVCEQESKIISAFTVTDAAVHDSQALETLISTGVADSQELYADSAYRSAEIEEKLASRGIRSRVHHRAYKDRPLTEEQIATNTTKSRKRARVEHVFGFMTNSMGGMTAKCCSKARNAAVIGLMNLTYNLCRVVQLRRTVEMRTN